MSWQVQSLIVLTGFSSVNWPASRKDLLLLEQEFGQFRLVVGNFARLALKLLDQGLDQPQTLRHNRQVKRETISGCILNSSSRHSYVILTSDSTKGQSELNYCKNIV